MDWLGASRAARDRIRSHVRHTPLELSRPFSAELGFSVHLKLENFQVTGSFKARGALSRLTADRDARPIAAASSGNHGAGVAYGLSLSRRKGTVFVPRNAVEGKVNVIRGYGAEVRVEGATCEESEAFARRHAEVNGWTFVSPYNDPQVVAGQGTLGLEMAEDLKEAPEAVFVSVGGGGLIGGVGAVLKALWPGVKIVGCSPENDCAMARSLEAGHIVAPPAKPTLSDGTAGAVERGSLTFPLCRSVVDEFVLVTESEIRSSLLETMERHRFLIEGAAAVAVAGLKRYAASAPLRSAAVVLCGGNLFPTTLKTLLR